MIFNFICCIFINVENKQLRKSILKENNLKSAKIDVFWRICINIAKLSASMWHSPYNPYQFSQKDGATKTKRCMKRKIVNSLELICLIISSLLVAINCYFTAILLYKVVRFLSEARDLKKKIWSEWFVLFSRWF